MSSISHSDSFASLISRGHTRSSNCLQNNNSSNNKNTSRCCCNFFRQNPRRFPCLFSECVFSRRKSTTNSGWSPFSNEKCQILFDVKQSTRSAPLTIIILIEKLTSQQQQPQLLNLEPSGCEFMALRTVIEMACFRVSLGWPWWLLWRFCWSTFLCTAVTSSSSPLSSWVSLCAKPRSFHRRRLGLLFGHNAWLDSGYMFCVSPGCDPEVISSCSPASRGEVCTVGASVVLPRWLHVEIRSPQVFTHRCSVTPAQHLQSFEEVAHFHAACDAQTVDLGRLP